MSSDHVRDHFDQVAGGYDRGKERARYYYSELKLLVAELVPKGSHVLEVGCGTGDILASLEPSVGVGIDLSSEMVALARQKHPSLRFLVHSVVDSQLDEAFDFVVAIDVMEHLSDLNRAMASMARMLAPGGSLVVTTADPRWGHVLDVAERLKLKMPEGEHQWRSHDDLVAAARAAGLVERFFDRSFLVPRAIPLLKALNTARWAAPLRRRYGLIQRVAFQSTGAL